MSRARSGATDLLQTRVYLLCSMPSVGHASFLVEKQNTESLPQAAQVCLTSSSRFGIGAGEHGISRCVPCRLLLGLRSPLVADRGCFERSLHGILQLSERLLRFDQRVQSSQGAGVEFDLRVRDGQGIDFAHFPH